MSAINKLLMLLVFTTELIACKSHAQDIVLVNDKQSEYTIIIPEKPTPLEKKAATVLQTYIRTTTGCELPIHNEEKRHAKSAIYIGETFYGNKAYPGKLKNEGYLLEVYNSSLLIKGGSGRGLLFGVYEFLERYAGCRMYYTDATIAPTKKMLAIPGDLKIEESPAFEYREAYYPPSLSDPYLEWHKLHRLNDLWGLWGHSFDKLVPGKIWFATHPEYFAMVKGVRQSSQLCLSNKDVFDLVVSELQRRIKANPEAMYWSVSQNDDNGYCQCPQCKAIDDEQGGPQGSLITFVNKVAKQFPDKRITTLAYGYSHKSPKSLKPADNVYVFLSDIEAYRDKPLREEGTAAPFRHDLETWGKLTQNIFVWDYTTQFTNYLAPFPNIETFKSNICFMKEKGVRGIFTQGSGETYSEWGELKSYVLAKLLWDTGANVQKMTDEFLSAYYGDGAAKYLTQYLSLMHERMKASKRKLDIYGNPESEYNTWLSPDNIDQYSQLLDKAEAEAEKNPVWQERLTRCRLSLDYAVYQQARVFGIEKYGVFVKDDKGKWVVKPRFSEKINAFVTNCNKAGVKEMSEDGAKPDQYLAEWDSIFAKGVTPSKIVGAKVELKFPFAGDYPAKGVRTLVDGNPGYKDFSYNWLCFYGVPMVATIKPDAPVSCTSVKLHFLDDPRHWIFPPDSISLELAINGAEFQPAGSLAIPQEPEHFDVRIPEYVIPIKLKKKETITGIRITAKCPATFPAWRDSDKKKPMIACDEIFAD